MSGILTPKFRVSYPAVFKAKFNKLSKKDEYSVVALFEKGQDLSVLQNAARELAAKKWPKGVPKSFSSPFKDQGEREKEMDDGRKVLPSGYEKGALYINLKSTQRPGLVDAKRNEIIDSSEFYAGCYARADVSIYAYEEGANSGIRFGLSNIQKLADGEQFSGRLKAEDAFAPIEESSDISSKSDIFGESKGF